MNATKPVCTICGEPMPEGEEMFEFHGYSGPCPKPPLARTDEQIREAALAKLTPDERRVLGLD